MNIWHDIASERVNPQDFYAIIEIPKGCKVKYELDKETGMLLMDRVLYTSTHYPANYGFIPKTYADDHDPLDVLLLCSETLVPLSMVRCFPIGVIMMEDGGEKDEKIIALPYGDPTYNSYKDISELPEHIMERNVPFLFRVQGSWKARKPSSSPSRITRAPRKSSPIALPNTNRHSRSTPSDFAGKRKCAGKTFPFPHRTCRFLYSHHFQAAAVNLFCSIDVTLKKRFSTWNKCKA